ncbi:MAG: TetR/AcrR family transcriptional regulator [Aliarcobacter sp.]|nr:TetR/AcrR family transcriptional regulator [Aliarcobacter sp.]
MKTRELILKVAEEEFSKLGYDAVSMNNLVKKLNINKATIYYHFLDKRTLYHEIIKDVFSDINQRVGLLFAKNLEPKVLFTAYVNTIVTHIIVSLALREMANYGNNVDDSIMPYIEDELQKVELILKKLDLKESYKDINPLTFIALINGTIKEFYVIQMSSLSIGKESELKNDSEKTLNYIAEFVSNIIFDAIVKK